MILLLACTGTEPAPAGERLVAYSEPAADPLEALEPVWSPEDFEGAVTGLGDTTLPDPSAIAELYKSLFEWGDEVCPGLDDDLSPPEVPLFGCTADSGATYAGLSEFDQTETSITFALGDFSITTPDGHAMTVAGNFFLDTGFGTILSFTGTWIDPAAEGWIGDGGSIYLDLFDDGQGIQIDGSIGGAQPVYMDEFDADCGGNGLLGLYGPEGGWYTTQLECGCGPLRFQGEVLADEVCVDTDPFVANLRGMVE